MNKWATRAALLILVASPLLVASFRLSTGCRGALVARPYQGEWIGTKDLDRLVPMSFALPGGSYSLFINLLGLRIDCGPTRTRDEPPRVPLAV